ncbi:MAG: DUF4254 domain-containing protein [Aquabacterium sp.]|jgi:hypothetical protein|uniref:DUF4254 domain-containing protein n=1 Tax=Aquabacterium sp. TaxID=1872578 RepID=UPI003BB1E8F8
MTSEENTLSGLAAQVIDLHDAALAASGGPPVAAPAEPQDFNHLYWIRANHRFNSLLWAEEDLARRTQVGDSEIAANKRAIDGYNQARNDATERVDELLLVSLGLVDRASAATASPVSLASASARLNSETAGSIIDRMSIMALKVHAMRWQTQRTDVDDEHRQSSAVKLARLEQQRKDLASCLDRLVADCQSGAAHFKIYRQFKMYNDPRFNPALVAERGPSQGKA